MDCVCIYVLVIEFQAFYDDGTTENIGISSVVYFPTKHLYFHFMYIIFNLNAL